MKDPAPAGVLLDAGDVLESRTVQGIDGAPSVRTIGKIAFVATTAPVTFAFAGSGAANLLRFDHVAHDMMLLGYPTYFMTILGVWKLLGAVVVALPRLPRLKEWAYAGIIFDLTGAAASRAASNHGALAVLVPLGLAVAALISWRLRPVSRMLPSTRR